MNEITAELIKQGPVLVIFIAGIYTVHQRMNNQARIADIRFENMNTRFDDVNHRIDDLRADNKTLSENVKADNKTLTEKLDTVSAQVHRIEGALNLPRTGTED